MKKVTSATMHMTSEGQRLSYTYSVIDENTGAIVSENNRNSLIVLPIDANEEVLAAVDTVMNYIKGKLGD